MQDMIQPFSRIPCQLLRYSKLVIILLTFHSSLRYDDKASGVLFKVNCVGHPKVYIPI